MQNLFAVKVIQKLSAFFYHATACNATHGIAKAFFSVCLSVKHVLCDETKESSADFLIPHERSFMGRPTVPVFFKFCSLRPEIAVYQNISCTELMVTWLCLQPAVSYVWCLEIQFAAYEKTALQADYVTINQFINLFSQLRNINIKWISTKQCKAQWLATRKANRSSELVGQISTKIRLAFTKIVSQWLKIEL